MIQKLLPKPKCEVEVDAELSVLDLPTVVVPRDAYTLAGFIEWRIEREHPKRPRVAFLNGEVWIDMNAEIMETHNILKTEIVGVINQIVNYENLGFVLGEGMLISVRKANISNEPDALFVSLESLRTGRVKRKANKKQKGTLVIEGPPEWVLEVVSDSSVQKDTVILKDKYFRAGVQEYWLVDARQEKVDFKILVPGKTEFMSQPRRGGWVTSPLFKRKFSLQRKTIADDFWRWELQHAILSKKKA